MRQKAESKPPAKSPPISPSKPPSKLPSRSPGWFVLILYGMLSILCCLYIFFVIDPRLLYHLLTTTHYPELSSQWFFVSPIIASPGGTVQYLSGFMAAWCYYPWLGALVITAVAVAVSFACRILTASSGSIVKELLSIVPAIAVVMMYNHYDVPMAVCTAVAVSLWFAVPYKKTARTNPVGRIVIFLVLFSVLYYLTGAAALLFGVLAAIVELGGDRKFLLPPLYLLFIAVAVWFLGAVVSDLLIGDAYTILLPLGPEMRALTLAAGQVLYVYILLFVLGSVLWRPRGVKKAPSKSMSRRRRRAILYTTAAMALLAVSGTTLYVTHDKTEKQTLLVDSLAHQGRWQEVLEKASAVPSALYDLNCNHNVNKALYYTGQLTERMFEFPQSMPALLLVYIRGQTSGPLFLNRMLLFLSLGYVNTAEHLAHELLENLGDSPLLLETLAKINLIKGQPETARVFLEKMRRNPISAGKARRILDQLEKDPLLSGDIEMQRLRSVAVEEKTVSSGFEFDRFFGTLLKRNNSNKMAVEYMMASYLLTGNVEEIAANIHRLEDIGYEKAPRYLEEALAIYMDSQDQKIYFDNRWMPGPDAIERARDFVRASSAYGVADAQAAMNELARDFGDSYYYYFVFNVQN